MSNVDDLRAAFAAGSLVRPSQEALSIVDLSRAAAQLAGAPNAQPTPGSRALADLIGPCEHLILIIMDGLGKRLIEALPKESFLDPPGGRTNDGLSLHYGNRVDYFRHGRVAQHARGYRVVDAYRRDRRSRGDPPVRQTLGWTVAVGPRCDSQEGIPGPRAGKQFRPRHAGPAA